MASAEDYAAWIVANPEKRGTPEFATVAAAYQAAKQPAQVSQSVGAGLRDVPRQVGLAARYGVEGLGQILDIGAEPIRQLAVNPILRAAGASPAASLSSGSKALADLVGLPSPQTPDERVIGDASRLVVGAGGMAGLAGGASRMLTGAASKAAETMAAKPFVQAVGGASAGAAGGAVREAGGGPFEQFAAALAGGVAGGVGADKIAAAGAGLARAAKSAFTPRAVELQRADQQISLILERGGIDWSQVPERIKQGMRDEVAAALNTGQPLNSDALRRLLVFKRAEVTPTVGQLTQNPGLITREKNLAKTGANSTSPALQRLPMLENENVASLLRQLDEAGAAGAPSASGTGMAAINSLDSTVAQNKRQIGQLYDAARDTQGRSLPLEGGTFARRANELLDEAMAGDSLPKAVENRLNAIANGNYPLTVASAEAFKTRIGKLQRGSNDGNTKHALGLVRQALDEAPLQNDRIWNPGNVPAMPGQVPPSTAAAGEQSIAAFNEARRANRAWMQRVEGNPALKAVVDGVEPDQFVQRFVVGQGATAADVRALRQELNPQAVQSLRSYLVRYLKDAATGGDQDIVKFGGKSYRDALRRIEDKLPAFFSREEIQKLRDLGDAAKYMQSQPAGSAVNNSNSGALLIGRGLDIIEQAAQKLPVGKDAITGVIQGMQQRQVMAPRNALVSLVPPRQGMRVNPLLAATVPGQVSNENSRR